MSYDQELARQIADLLGESGVEVDERAMFGGLAFMVGGNMAVVVSGAGGIMVRVEPETTGELLASSCATIMEMQGRAMTGWVRVMAEHLGSDAELSRWVDTGVARARSLPSN